MATARAARGRRPGTRARGGLPARLPVRLRGRLPARLRGRGRDRGQVAIEFLGFLPILLVIALAVIQLGLGAYAVQQAGTAARAAARTASMDATDVGGDPSAAGEAAGRAAVSGWLGDGATVSVGGGGDAVHATATVRIPSVLPGIDFGTASRSATMARPAGPHALGGQEHTVPGDEGAAPR
ncbi:TadE/TadG family type IV pilus assembly protein [Streptomyces celluloflavus]|uniref:TadE/TadG family type IV pilus assembly protein n=1 Tax=Streptomyces celluloflavus TaxID=58344 RepID=UPI0036B60C24